MGVIMRSMGAGSNPGAAGRKLCRSPAPTSCVKTAVVDPNRMLSLDEALDRVLRAAVPLAAESFAVAEVYNRVLAEDVISPSDLPSFDHSAMDGYAVASADLAGMPPFELAVFSESRAGHPPPLLERGSAC